MSILEFMCSESENTTKTVGKETIWSLPYIVLLFVNFTQHFSLYITNTIIPLYLDHLGIAASIIGIGVGSFAVTAILIRPFSGPAFDSFPRKRLIIIAMVISSISVFAYGFVDDFVPFIAIRLVHGVGMGCMGPLCLTLVSTYLPLRKMASGIAIYTVAQSLSQVIGPAAGLYLYEILGFGNTFFLSAGLIVLALLAISSIKEKPYDRMPYQLRLDRMFTKDVLEEAIVLMLLVGAFVTTNSYLVLYSQSLGVDNIGLYFSVYALCLLGTRPLFGKLADRFGTPKVVFAGVVIFAISFVLIGMARTLEDFLVAAAVSSLGFGASSPLIQSIALAKTPPERRGATSNTTFTGCDFGNLLGPAIAGSAIAVLTTMTDSLSQAYSIMWFVMIVPIAVSLIVIIRWMRR